MNIYILEGIDGAGKSTAARAIKEIFPSKRIIQFREPCGVFRQILIEAGTTKGMSLLNEWMAFWMGRYDLWMNQILPKINKRNTIVIIDRSYASTYAYQIEGRGLRQYEESFFFWKKNLINPFLDKNVKIHHIYLRVSVDVGLSRVGVRKAGPDDLIQFEKKDLLERVKTGFDFFYGPGNKRNFSPIEHVHIIDASKTQQEVMDQIKAEIAP